MQSPMPWSGGGGRCGDAAGCTQMQRQGQLAERLELDWERLQFAMERFEDAKLADKRRVAVAFLAACGRYKRGRRRFLGESRLIKVINFLKTRKSRQVSGWLAHMEK